MRCYLSSESVLGVRKTSDMLLSSRKAIRNAEEAMNATAGILTRAKSELSIATVKMQRLSTQAATERAWLNKHTHIKLKGNTAEHRKLQQLLTDLGPGKLLERKLTEVERLKGGLETHTIAEQLELKVLTLEAGVTNGGSKCRPRHYLRIKDVDTGEICLEWETPTDQRLTDPAMRDASETDALTRRLHGSIEEREGSIASSSRPSTPR